MRNFKLTLEYDGTAYQGWQVQSANHRTVQGEIERALNNILKAPVRIAGAGRTDSGVHAEGQVAHFKAKTKMRPQEILRALNANLPKDIVVKRVTEVPLSFHAQYSAKRKTYRYQILTSLTPSALNHRYFLHFPQPLNLKHMRREARCLIGTHDFKSFMAADSAQPKEKIKNSTRHIYSLRITKRKDILIITFEANGFLYKMVRNIMGTLLDVGTGRLKRGEIKSILAQKNRKFAGKTAPAHGLFLVKVIY